jgi:hypothetical protein
LILKVNTKSPRVQDRFRCLIQAVTSHYKVKFTGDEIRVGFKWFEDNTLAQVTSYTGGSYYVIEVHSPLRGRWRDFNFLHECVHMADMKTKRFQLVWDWNINRTDWRYIWEGKRYCTVGETEQMSCEEYLSLPWESNADKVAAECLKGLTRNS